MLKPCNRDISLRNKRNCQVIWKENFAIKEREGQRIENHYDTAPPLATENESGQQGTNTYHRDPPRTTENNSGSKKENYYEVVNDNE